MIDLKEYIVAESYDKNDGIKHLKDVILQETVKENVKVVSDIWKRLGLDYLSFCKATGTEKPGRSYRWMVDRHYEGYLYGKTADDRRFPVSLSHPESRASWDILIDRNCGDLYANYLINELKKLGCEMEEESHGYVFVNIK